jgi:glycerophosphoryl diester phosphodiesterase
MYRPEGIDYQAPVCKSFRMLVRYPSRRQPPIGFAHRGASAHAPENTIEAFSLAVRLGAEGLESDVWITRDGVPVLDHDGVVASGLRRRPIAEVDRSDLPGHIPTLDEFYRAVGPGFEVSLDVKDACAAAPTIAVAREHAAAERLWLCHDDVNLVIEWRALGNDIKLVDSTRLRRIKEGPERRCALLAASGIDALNMHYTDWNAGLVALAHRFERDAFAWDCQFERTLVETLALGVDAVYSDHTDRMIDSLARGTG